MNELWNVMILFGIIITIILVQKLINVQSKFYYITIATKPHPVLTKLLDASHSFGEDIKVLGLQENKDIGWNKKGNFGIKLREVHQFLQKPELGANDIVFFSDAYDVAQIGSQKEIEWRFKYLFQKPIVFGAEKSCHPDKDRVSEYGLQLPGTEFSFLNSGLFVGRVWALRQCFAGYKYEDAEDDQRYWTTQYFKRRDLIELDTHARIFLNCAFVEQDDIVWDSFNNRVTYRRTQTHPLMVHANGHDKSFLYPFIGRWSEPPKA